MNATHLPRWHLGSILARLNWCQRSHIRFRQDRTLVLLVISPYARRNFVDHTLADQTSIARFIEDNWGLPRLGGEAMDQWAGSLAGMFDFNMPARKMC